MSSIIVIFYYNNPYKVRLVLSLIELDRVIIVDTYAGLATNLIESIENFLTVFFRVEQLRQKKIKVTAKCPEKGRADIRLYNLDSFSEVNINIPNDAKDVQVYLGETGSKIRFLYRDRLYVISR